MKATISLMGLYNYDPQLFNGFYFPSKWTAEDQDNFIDKLLFDTAELEILYPDPVAMNIAMKTWSRSMRPNWDKLYDTTQFDYNPIWNKDGIITETETIKRDNAYADQKNGSGNTHNITTNNLSQVNKSSQNTDTKTENNTTANNSQETNSNGTNKDYVFGFNETTAAQSEQHESDNKEKTSGTNSQNNTVKGSETVTLTAEQSNTGTINDAGSSSNAETINHSGSDNEGREYSRKEQGNIGITTTQQMIREEREVDTFNLMDYIIDSFKQRFCIMVY